MHMKKNRQQEIEELQKRVFGKDRSVNKSLEELFTANCRIHGENSVMNPSLILETNTNSFNANYCYIPDLARYYYIKDWKLDSGLRIVFNCHVDVLQSYATQIKEQTAIIQRQENKWNLYLNDGSFKVYQNPNVLTKPFPNGFTTNEFVLAIAGS